MKSFWTILIGTILLMVGAGWLLIITGVVDSISGLLPWWPLFLIVPFGIRLLLCPDKFLSLLFVCLGVIFLMHAHDFIIHDLQHVLYYAAPIAVILFALHLLFDRDRWWGGWFGGPGPRH